MLGILQNTGIGNSEFLKMLTLSQYMEMNIAFLELLAQTATKHVFQPSHACWSARFIISNEIGGFCYAPGSHTQCGESHKEILKNCEIMR